MYHIYNTPIFQPTWGTWLSSLSWYITWKWWKLKGDCAYSLYKNIPYARICNSFCSMYECISCFWGMWLCSLCECIMQNSNLVYIPFTSQIPSGNDPSVTLFDEWLKHFPSYDRENNPTGNPRLVVNVCICNCRILTINIVEQIYSTRNRICYLQYFIYALLFCSSLIPWLIKCWARITVQRWSF